MSYLDVSWRTKRYLRFIHPYGRSFGEGLYVLSFSNFKWPDGVSYPEVRDLAMRQFDNEREAGERERGKI